MKRRAKGAPHTHAPTGKKVIVVLKNGETFVDKFFEHHGNKVKFFTRTVYAGEIKSFTIKR